MLNSRAKRALIVPGFLRVRFIGFVLFCALFLPLLLKFFVRFDVGPLFFIFVVFYGLLYLVQTDDLYLVARRKTYIISIGRIGVYLFLFPIQLFVLLNYTVPIVVVGNLFVLAGCIVW